MVRQMLSTSPQTLSPISSARWHQRSIWHSLPRTRDIAIYASGALFAIGWWTFINAIVFLAINRSESLSKITVQDWICGVLATIGMIIVNLIDRSIITDDIYTFSRSLFRASSVLFIGYALLAGGFIGSMAVFFFDYVGQNKSVDEFYFGINIVVQNACILMSSIVLWIGQGSHDESRYEFVL